MRKTFTRATYIAWAVLFTALTYASMAWIPLARFVGELAAQADSLFSITPVIASVLWEGLFELPAVDMQYALLLALLTGINFSMLLFYIRKARVRSSTPVETSVLGFFIGILGFGCAACGALVAHLLLAAIAGAGLADQLPQSGLSFQIVGIGLMLYSILRLNRAISDPLVCEPE